MKRLPFFDKVKAVREVIEYGNSLQKVSKKFGCSRQTLALWVKSYKNDPKSLKYKFKKGKSHHKSISWKVEKKVVDLVIKEPDFSISKLLNQDLQNVSKLIKIFSAYTVE